jgi:hypothetical protein
MDLWGGSFSEAQLAEPLIELPGVAYVDWLAETAADAGSYLDVATPAGSSLARIDCPSIAIDPPFSLNRNVAGRSLNSPVRRTISKDCAARCAISP